MSKIISFGSQEMQQEVDDLPEAVISSGYFHCKGCDQMIEVVFKKDQSPSCEHQCRSNLSGNNLQWAL